MYILKVKIAHKEKKKTNKLWKLLSGIPCSPEKKTKLLSPLPLQMPIFLSFSTFSFRPKIK